MFTLFLDFDNTIIRGEGLDELARLALKSDTSKLLQVEHITNMGMTGQMNMEESLTKRLQLFHANKSILPELVEELKTRISPSFLKHKAFINQWKENIYIVSGGFDEYVKPIGISLGVKPEHIFANTFIYENDIIIDFDKTKWLYQNKGKVKVVNSIITNTQKIAVGDGFTDLEIKLEHAADIFIYYSEHIIREGISQQSDYICHSFDDVIKILNV